MLNPRQTPRLSHQESAPQIYLERDRRLAEVVDRFLRVTHNIIDRLVLPACPSLLFVPFNRMEANAVGLLMLSTRESEVRTFSHVLETLRSVQLRECGVLLLGIGGGVRGERKENGSYVFEILAVVDFDDSLHSRNFKCRKLVDSIAHVAGVDSGDEFANLSVFLFWEVGSRGSNIWRIS